MTTYVQSEFYHLIQSGKIAGYEIVNKFGRNPDVDAGTEDIWNGGATYTGFPAGSPEELQIVSDNAGDTGTVTFQYLASASSTEWLTATATLNGITPVNTGVTVYRVHTAYYDSGSPTGFNLGTITLSHAVTTANVFCLIPVGRSQTNACVYRVPTGKTGYIVRFFGETVGGTSSNNADFALWVRTNGDGPRLRRPHSTNEGDRFDESIAGGVVIPENSDIKVQATVTGSNLKCIAGFDIIIAENGT